MFKDTGADRIELVDETGVLILASTPGVSMFKDTGVDRKELVSLFHRFL